MSFLIVAGPGLAQAQLYINEISQGTSGTKEFAEFVVVGDRTCTDSCADIRGWIMDDNNGWHGNNGIALGCVRFAYIPQWACVPYGSIILVYNPSDKNTNIILPDDETDSNGDGVYVIPVNSSTLDKDNTQPSSGSPSYANLIFSNGGASWTLLGMRNQGDVFHLVSPANLNAAYFSVGWGDVTVANDIYFSGQASGLAYYFDNAGDDNIRSQQNWKSAAAGTAAETPGMPNSPANALWLQQMRDGGLGVTIIDTVNVSICSGQSYFTAGGWQTADGYYTDLYTASNGCDSNVVVALRVQTALTQHTALTGCGSISIDGQIFYTSTIYRDTLRYTTGCDSLYRIYSITITDLLETELSTCIIAGQSYYAGGGWQTNSGVYLDTLVSVNGCDSIVTTRLQVLQPQTVILQFDSCKQVTHEGIVYTQSTTLRDTVFSALGCDSIYRSVILLVYPIPALTLSPSGEVTIQKGDSVTISLTPDNYPSYQWSPEFGLDHNNTPQIIAQPESTTLYQVLVSDENGCTTQESILVRVIEPQEPVHYFVPNVFTPNGDGSNDVFQLVYTGDVTVLLTRLYNRWGELVFDGIGNEGWNGTFRGVPQPMGIYVYYISILLPRGETRNLSGSVTLLR